jgi:two-component system OmpR family sensor kinase
MVRWSLRGRLVAATVALLALVCAVIGLVTVLALQKFLVGQLDSQLDRAGSRVRLAQPGEGGEGGLSPRGDYRRLLPPGQGAGTLGAQVVGGTVTAGLMLDESGTPKVLPTDVDDVLARLTADGRPHSRDLPGLGTYRLEATTNATDGTILITGLPLAPVDDVTTRLAVVTTAVGAAGLLLAGMVGALIVRATLRPLERVAATASRVAELPLDRGEVALSVRVPEADTDPHTEVGQVGNALNRMLGHVAAALRARHASETRVRQFVADASHELRTPLTSIRGYAELTRRIGADVPDDVRYAMHRVESEAARMTTLVEDLLLLASLDAGRPMRQDQVDLTRVVVDAVSDAHVAGAQHHWQLDVPEDPVPVFGDGARLHQVVANLLANARTHTPPGTTVTTRLAVRPTGEIEPSGRPVTQAVLTVSDDGPGIPPALLPDVFERFARGDSSRSRAAGSTGLGLAIVAAVVSAHHGAVSVSSVPGGTEFMVRLPLLGRPPQDPASA